MKKLLDILFLKLFDIFRLVFLAFFAYCTTIMTTTDYITSLSIGIIGIGILVVISIRYIYIRNDKSVKDAFKTSVLRVIKDNRSDIIGSTKMIVMDFFIGLLALTFAIHFFKKII